MERAAWVVGALLPCAGSAAAQPVDVEPTPVRQGDLLHRLDLGWMVAAAGDVDGDGCADLAVGEDLEEDWHPLAKDRVFVIAGGPNAARDEGREDANGR